MGLRIHYSGKMEDVERIPALVEEVREVCDVLDWPWRIRAEQVNGIPFTPPDCETVGLNFLPNGELVSRVMLLYDIHPATTVSVKTQYAGMEVHRTVIKLLKHVSKQYFSAFELSDEGQYWETGYEDVLQKQFGVYNRLLEEVQKTMKDFTAEEGDTPERLADRLEKLLKERWKGTGKE